MNAFWIRPDKGFAAIALSVLAALVSAAPLKAQAPFKVFMIASKAQDHLSCSLGAKPVVEQMGAANGFTVDFTTDTGLITEANLAKYQVFMQMHLAPFEMSIKHRAAFQKFVDGGKGWVGIHAAGLTGGQFSGSEWTWYTGFFGGVTYVNHPALQTGTLVFEDRTHPATRNMPASFQVKDEWYEWNGNPRPNVRVLGKADESTYNPLKRQGDHPMVWTNESHPKMIYISVGHDVSVWSNPNYLMLVRDALLWAKPVSTGIDPLGAEKGYLGASPGSAGVTGTGNRLWFRDGRLYLGPLGLGAPAAGATRMPGYREHGLRDATGRTLAYGSVASSAIPLRP